MKNLIWRIVYFSWISVTLIFLIKLIALFWPVYVDDFLILWTDITTIAIFMPALMTLCLGVGSHLFQILNIKLKLKRYINIVLIIITFSIGFSFLEFESLVIRLIILLCACGVAILYYALTTFVFSLAYGREKN